MSGLDGTAAAEYLRLRAELTDPHAALVQIPASADPAFWRAYAAHLRRSDRLADEPGPDGPTFPPATGAVAMWTTAGLGAEYARRQIAHLEPAALRLEDVADAVGQHQRGAPLHFVLAVLTAQGGYSAGYLGLMRRVAPDRTAREDPLTVLDLWNDTHSEPRLRSLCAHLTRDQVLRELPAGLENTASSCWQRPDGWCGECVGCAELYYAAKALGRGPRRRLTAPYFDALDRRYAEYLRTGFASDPGNDLQLLVHLQLTYGLRLDRAVDTDGAL